MSDHTVTDRAREARSMAAARGRAMTQSPDTPSDRCAWSGQSETADDTLLPFGVNRHPWLHSRCRDLWAERRHKAAIEALAIMGIVEPAQ
jgi:hypothetical protein